MSQFEYKQFYHRNRPHIHPPDSTLFVTFRLAGSIPKAVVRQYRNEKLLREREVRQIAVKTEQDRDDERTIEFHRKWFKRFDETLDKAAAGPMWLGETAVRRIVYDKLIEDSEAKYRLDAFSIMSNHVHIVFKPNLSVLNLREEIIAGRVKFVSDEDTLAEIMQSVKGVTARKCNMALGRSGSFWEKESFDHVIRDDNGFARAVRYTLNNPVKA